MTPAIDAHLHLWRLARGDYAWITPDLAPLRRDFEPEDAAAELAGAGIAGAVVVQAAPTVAETRFLLDHASRHDWILGVVGWVDMAAADAPRQIADLARDPKLRGLRPMIQDMPDERWMLRSELGPAFRAMIECGLAFEALVLERHLPHLEALLARHPDLRVVIDHAAKPEIRNARFTPWSDAVSRLAAIPSVTCKLSGLVTEAGPDVCEDQLGFYVDHLLTAFGPERLIFGSDWPVLRLRTGYADWHAMARRLLSGLGTASRADVFGGNAQRFYRLAAD